MEVDGTLESRNVLYLSLIRDIFSGVKKQPENGLKLKIMNVRC